MEKSKVYFIKEVSPENVVRAYEALGVELKGNVAVKLHSGEPGNQNFLRPDFMKPAVDRVGGTIVECNTAYDGQRDTTEAHKKTMQLHGWVEIADVDIMDAEGEMTIPVVGGKHLDKNYVGKTLPEYDSMLVLSHFKGHPMGGYGGALKNISIGIASSYGKKYIHGVKNTEDYWHADHDSFLECMADAAKSIVDHFGGKMAFVNIMKNMSVDCDCCAVAEAYGVLLYCHTFTTREIRIVTACDAFAERLPKLFRRAFGAHFVLPVAEKAGGRHVLTITDRAAVETVFAAFGADLSRTVAHHINLAVLENDCCKASFLRGAFLAGGSVTAPSKNYHLELITAHASVSRETAALLTELGFAARSIDRGANTVLYFKKSEAIEDFLTKIGAPCAAMDIMSAKVEKSMNNSINRKVNCDTANADKVVAAAQEQIDAIRRIERDYGLDVLPEKLQSAALLRIANPEASLADLATLSYPPVTKSCLNYRLKKLMEFHMDD